MFTTKNKMLSMLALVILASLIVLPILLSGTVIVSSMLTIVGYYAFTQCNIGFDIDFKYWFSFVSQLLGLIFFVVSFLMIFTLGANFVLV